MPHVGSGWIVFRHIARDEPAYGALGGGRRVLVAVIAGLLVAARFTTVEYGRRLLRRAGLLAAARRVLSPLRAHRHRSGR